MSMAASQEEWLAAWRASRYAFPWRGEWRACSLDGDEQGLPWLTRPVCLLTAWNPGAVERPRAWNEAASARLLRALTAAGLPWVLAWGGSLPGVRPAWREEGVAVFDLDREAALRLGRDWGQRAVVLLARDEAGLLTCDDGRFHRCRVRPQPVSLEIG